LLTLFVLPLVNYAQNEVPATQKFSLVEIGVATGLAPSVFNPFGNYKLEAFAPGSAFLADTEVYVNSTQFACGILRPARHQHATRHRTQLARKNTAFSSGIA
jgi:hypothetical protein